MISIFISPSTLFCLAKKRPPWLAAVRWARRTFKLSPAAFQTGSNLTTFSNVGNVMVLLPPYCTTATQLRQMVTALAESVAELK